MGPTPKMRIQKNPGILSIFIKPLNDRPRLIANLGIKAVEQKTIAITANSLNSEDVDSSESSVIYSLLDLPKFGVLKKNNKILARGGEFSQSDITQGRVLYEHRSESNQPDSFKFSVSDSKNLKAMMASDENPAVFEISIEPVNDAPRVLFVSSKKLKERGKVVINGSDIKSVDIDNKDDEISYILAKPPKNGSIYRDGRLVAQGESFTQEELYDNAITYKHNGSDGKSDSFKFASER